MVAKRTMTISHDIRHYFGRQPRRVLPDNKTDPSPSPCASVPPSSPHPSIDSPPQTSRQPLYASPPRLRDLAPRDVPSEGDDEKCANLCEYLQLVRRSPDEWRQRETGLLEGVFGRAVLAEIGFPAGDLSVLCIRLIRRLAEEEISAAAGGPAGCDLAACAARWLSSPFFLAAVSSIADVLAGAPRVHAARPWDVLMAIEPVIRAEPLISAGSISTLLERERAILYWEVWREPEPLYDLLLQEQAACQSRRKREQVSSPEKALLSMATSSASAGPLTPLEFFFRKFLRAAAAAVEHAVHALALPSQVRELSWALFVGAVEAELRLRLLFERNLLTLVACAVYSVAKLLDEDRSFAQIIAVFQRHFPSFGDGWYREIRVPGHGARADLVYFYNHVYLGCMRERIYALHGAPRTPDRRAPAAGRPPATPFPPAPPNTVVFSRNVRLDVSPDTLHRRMSPTAASICIAILGNLGVRHDQQPPGAAAAAPAAPSRQIARQLKF